MFIIDAQSKQTRSEACKNSNNQKSIKHINKLRG